MDPASEQALLDELPAAFVAADDEGRIRFMSEPACRILGWAPGAALGRPLTDLMPERMRLRHLQGFARFRKTRQSRLLGRPVRVPALRSDGTEILVDVRIRLFRRPDGSHLVLAGVQEADMGSGEREVLHLEQALRERLYEPV
ncbi:MAG TPA: PAS domain-containing protein [Candidatus Thermoplasmatota archaeon]|nr:PAS domain-containing protein [Candidatus Thermoplasmatota archaeon]